MPDGKDDCKEGRNDVTVLVKNEGAASADGFAVRLLVDDDQAEAEEKTVSGLDAGKEQEVRFDDVRLRKGERTLTVATDAKNAVSESKEDNNERKVTATCKEDD